MNQPPWPSDVLKRTEESRTAVIHTTHGLRSHAVAARCVHGRLAMRLVAPAMDASATAVERLSAIIRSSWFSRGHRCASSRGRTIGNTTNEDLPTDGMRMALPTVIQRCSEPFQMVCHGPYSRGTSSASGTAPRQADQINGHRMGLLVFAASCDTEAACVMRRCAMAG